MGTQRGNPINAADIICYLSGFIDHIGDGALPPGGHHVPVVHAHGVPLATSTASSHGQATLHPTTKKKDTNCEKSTGASEQLVW